MKSIKLTFLFLMITISGFGSVVKDEIQSSKNLGLISYLSTIKNLSEHKMIELSLDPDYKINRKITIEFGKKYTLLKVSVDNLINQVSGDMTNKNRMQCYRHINKYLKGDTDILNRKFPQYIALIAEIDSRFLEFDSLDYSINKAAPGLDDYTGVFALGYTVISEAREAREKKVQSIVSILNSLKLTSLKPLLEPKES